MKYKIILAIIILFILIIRFYNLSYVTNVDEFNVVERAVMVADGNLHVSWYNWPAQTLIKLNGLVFYFIRLLNNSEPAISLFLNNNKIFYTAAHITTIFISIFVLLFVFLIGKKINNEKIGILATVFLGCSYLFSIHSRVATPDVFLALLLLIGIWLAHIILEKKYSVFFTYPLYGAVAALAVATKYPGLAILVPLLTVHIIEYANKNKWQIRNLIFNIYRLFNLPLLYFVLIFMLVHTLVNPYFFADFSIVKESFLQEAKTDRLEVDWGGASFPFFRNCWNYLIGSGEWNGTFISIFAYIVLVISIIFFKSKTWSKLNIIIIFFLCYLIGISALGLHWSRWAVPFSPIMALLAAYGINTAKNFLLKKYPVLIVNIFYSIIIVFIIIPPIFTIILKEYSLANKTTADQAREYIESKVSVNSKIAADTYNLNLSDRYRYDEPRIGLYNTLASAYAKQGTNYLLIQPNRLYYAQKEPDKYQNIINFFIDLEKQGKKIKGFRPTSSDILDKRWDWQVYKYLLTNAPSQLFNIVSGPKLVLYEI